MTRKLHQATRRSPARGTSERLGTRLPYALLYVVMISVKIAVQVELGRFLDSRGPHFSEGGIVFAKRRYPNQVSVS